MPALLLPELGDVPGTPPSLDPELAPLDPGTTSPDLDLASVDPDSASRDIDCERLGRGGDDDAQGNEPLPSPRSLGGAPPPPATAKACPCMEKQPLAPPPDLICELPSCMGACRCTASDELLFASLDVPLLLPDAVAKAPPTTTSAGTLLRSETAGLALAPGDATAAPPSPK